MSELATTDPEPIPKPVLRALSDPALRKNFAAAIYALLWGSLRYHEARVAKVRETASELGIDRRYVRNALDLLVALNYLRFSHRDSRKRRYYWLVDQRTENRGASRPPIAA